MASLDHLASLLRRIATTRPRAWGFAARAWLVAPSVELALRGAGIEPTLRWLEQLPGSAASEADIGVEEATELVRWACKLQPLTRNACLTRSLVQYALHRRDGIPARFVIGVRKIDARDAAAQPAPHGLDAHAWVEPLDDPNAARMNTGFTQLLQREHRVLQHEPRAIQQQPQPPQQQPQPSQQEPQS